MRTDANPEQKPKVSKQRLFLRPDEAKKLIAAAGERGRHRLRDRVLVLMTYRHGLRAGGEAVSLRWDNFDLAGGTVFVRRSKNGRGSTHGLEKDEIKLLKQLRKLQGDGTYVFETERGGPLSVDALQYIVREAGEKAELEVTAHPNMLRHAAGYSLANDGKTGIRQIQEFLGHKNIATTAHYTALAPARLANVRVR